MHLIFPCFDQINLKGNFKLIMIYPNCWTAYSNEIYDLEKPEIS